MTKEEIDRALNRGRILKIRTPVGDARIGKGASSLMSWLDSGPHGEAAQDSMNDGYFEEDEYEGY